jgi:hypothetical protein
MESTSSKSNKQSKAKISVTVSYEKNGFSVSIEDSIEISSGLPSERINEIKKSLIVDSSSVILDVFGENNETKTSKVKES